MRHVSRIQRNAVLRNASSQDPARGIFIFEILNPAIAQVSSQLDCAFIIVDLEHSGFSYESIGRFLAFCRHTQVSTLVRVPSVSPHEIAQVLDLGADGILLPNVRTAAQAADAVSWSKYPPQGTRGAAFGFAHDDYVVSEVMTTAKLANEANLMIAQVESKEGLENCEDIAATEGIDGLWLGQFDLTLDQGIGGQFDHPDFRLAQDRIARAANNQGKLAGMLCPDSAMRISAVASGYNVIAVDTDLGLLRRGLEHQLGDFL